MLISRSPPALTGLSNAKKANIKESKMNGKFFAGIAVAVILIAIGAFAFGVFEESQDGPLEDAVEAVDRAVK